MMRQQIDTIPIHEAFESGDECPFCWLERQAEQSAIRYTVGPCASYMEPDVRGVTDRQGFCREHMKKMHDYGNNLGNALILQTYYAGFLETLENRLDCYEPPEKRKLFASKGAPEESVLVSWAKNRLSSCFLCDKIEYNMSRYFQTFFAMLKDEAFCRRVEESKGFCMPHFIRLLEMAPEELPSNRYEWFYKTVLTLTRDNLIRVKGDLDWFVDKFDYRNAGADWKNSRDAVTRAMEKLQSGHPCDGPYRSEPR